MRTYRRLPIGPLEPVEQTGDGMWLAAGGEISWQAMLLWSRDEAKVEHWRELSCELRAVMGQEAL